MPPCTSSILVQYTNAHRRIHHRNISLDICIYLFKEHIKCSSIAVLFKNTVAGAKAAPFKVMTTQCRLGRHSNVYDIDFSGGFLVRCVRMPGVVPTGKLLYSANFILDAVK